MTYLHIFQTTSYLLQFILVHVWSDKPGERGDQVPHQEQQRTPRICHQRGFQGNVECHLGHRGRGDVLVRPVSRGHHYRTH